MQRPRGHSLCKGSANFDREARYVYSQRVSWIDLRHLNSAAVQTLSQINISRGEILYAETLGSVFESFQLLREDGRASVFKTEDYLSNYLGRVIALTSIKEDISIEDAAQMVLDDLKLLEGSDAKEKLN